MGDEELGKSRLLVNHTGQARPGNARDGAGVYCRCGGPAQRPIDQASLSEEVPVMENADHGLFSVLGLDRQLHIAGAYIKQGVSMVALGVDLLPVYIVARGCMYIDPLEEIKRSDWTRICGRHMFAPAALTSSVIVVSVQGCHLQGWSLSITEAKQAHTFLQVCAGSKGRVVRVC